jgi:hypothetical protein
MLHAITLGASAVAMLYRATIIQEVANGDLSPYSTVVDQADNFARVVGALLGVSSLTTFVLLVMWLYRITRYSRSEGAVISKRDGWAIGGFFIPIAQLWIPYQLARDNFRHYLQLGRITKQQFTYFRVWWIGFTLTALYSRSINFEDDATLTQMREAQINAAGAAVLMLITILFGIPAIRAIISSMTTKKT